MAQTLLGAIGSDIYGGLLGAGNTIFDLARAGGAYLGQPADMNYQQALALREEQEEQARKLLEASKPELLEAQKIIESRKPETPVTPVAPIAASSVTPTVISTAAPQPGLLAAATPQQTQAIPNVIAPLLGDIGQNIMDAYIAQGTLEASMPQLVTAQDLDKLRTITPQMVAAQAQKTRDVREAKKLGMYERATRDMKDRLATLKGLRDLTKEDDKKLQREAESIMDARQNVDFINKALSLVDSAYDYGALPTGVSQFGASMAANVAGTAAYDLESILTTIRARIGFDKLQEMRQNSPTGGALGQVSDFENRLLQATEGNLQLGVDPNLMKESLLNIRNIQMAIAHGIVDNTGQLRRLQSQRDVQALNDGTFRIAQPSDRIRTFNRQTGNIE